MLPVVVCLTASDSQHAVLAFTRWRCWWYELCECFLLLQVDAHEDDVNAVAFADETSNILYSGSDDGMCKVPADMHRFSIHCKKRVKL